LLFHDITDQQLSMPVTAFSDSYWFIPGVY